MSFQKDLIMNYRFLVYIDTFRIPFSKVSGIDAGMEKEIFIEGGENQTPYMITKPIEQMQILRLERGIQMYRSILDRIRPGIWLPYIEIIVNDRKGKPIYEYYVVGVYVTKWQIGDLDATTGNVVIETFEIEHSGMEKAHLG